MIVRALVDFLKDEQDIITTVVPVSGEQVNVGDGVLPYILVGEMSTAGRATNTMTKIFVRVAYPVNYQDELDNFILYKLHEILDRKWIDVVNGDVTSRTQVSVTSDITDIRPANTAGYIYRERVLEVPCRWR